MRPELPFLATPFLGDHISSPMFITLYGGSQACISSPGFPSELQNLMFLPECPTGISPQHFKSVYVISSPSQTQGLGPSLTELPSLNLRLILDSPPSPPLSHTSFSLANHQVLVPFHPFSG